MVQHLADPNAVLMVDETGLLTKGRHSAGVARQYSGTAGKVDHCQIGVILGDASPLGHALRDRKRYLPTEWTQDRDRCRRAGIPEDRGFATKPQLTQQMLARAVTAGVPAPWVTGDSGYGDDRHVRMWLEAQPQADVLAVSGQEYVWMGWRPRQVNTILTALLEDDWTRLSAGDGTKGPRWDDWRWLSLAAPRAPGWRRWLRVRRRLGTPTELTADVVFARDETTLDEVVRVAGTRWTIESGFEAAKSEVGLEHYEVRSWTGWFRHITLARWALALLTVLRAGAIAVEAFNKKRRPRQPESPLTAFKASRGLVSH
jgi:SRSO17 transposase